MEEGICGTRATWTNTSGSPGNDGWKNAKHLREGLDNLFLKSDKSLMGWTASLRAMTSMMEAGVVSYVILLSSNV